MLGNMQVKLDKQRQRVIINQGDESQEFTYEQIAEFLEQLFPARQ
jgi:hypothetical protein